MEAQIQINQDTRQASSVVSTQDKCGDPQDMGVFLIKLHVSW